MTPPSSEPGILVANPPYGERIEVRGRGPRGEVRETGRAKPRRRRGASAALNEDPPDSEFFQVVRQCAQAALHRLACVYADFGSKAAGSVAAARIDQNAAVQRRARMPPVPLRSDRGQRAQSSGQQPQTPDRRIKRLKRQRATATRGGRYNRWMNSSDRTHSLPSTSTARRRERVLAALRQSGGGVAIIPTAPRSHAQPRRRLSVPPRQLLLLPDGLHRARSDARARRQRRRRTSPRPSCSAARRTPSAKPGKASASAPKARARRSASTRRFPSIELDTEMPRLLADKPALHYALGSSAELDEQVRGWLDGGSRAEPQRRRRAVESAATCCRCSTKCASSRTTHELAIMRRAGAISAEAHRRAMHACRPGMREYELEAELLYTFRRHGAQAPAYGSIVAAGANACVLHYPAGNAIVQRRRPDPDRRRLRTRRLRLRHHAHVSRRAAASRRRSANCTTSCWPRNRPPSTPRAPAPASTTPHQAAVRVLSQGMLDTGIVDGNKFATVDDVIAERAYAPFYMHRTGHWLGMDVHDCRRLPRTRRTARRPGRACRGARCRLAWR